jgi:hypothetical protein
MPLCIRICLAIDLILMGSERAVPPLQGWLPLGGNSLTQFAILMCFGIAALEFEKRNVSMILPPLESQDEAAQPASDDEAQA